jgi:hypothetical protein
VKKARQHGILKTVIRSGSDLLKRVHNSAISESPEERAVPPHKSFSGILSG